MHDERREHKRGPNISYNILIIPNYDVLGDNGGVEQDRCVGDTGGVERETCMAR